MKPKNQIRRSISDRFDGAASISVDCFDQSKKNSISILIENKDTAEHRIALFWGICADTNMLSIISGVVVDAVAGDNPSLLDGKVIVSSKNLSYLQQHLINNPTAITGMQISAKDQIQLSKEITYKRIHPLRKFGETQIVPKEFQLAKDANTNLINIQVTDMVLGDQSVLAATVAPGNWLSLTIFLDTSRENFEQMVRFEAQRTNAL